MTVPKSNCRTIVMALSLGALLVSSPAQATPDKAAGSPAGRQSAAKPARKASSSSENNNNTNNSKTGKSGKISEQQALNIVRSRKEVLDWIRLIKESKKKNPQTGQAVVEIDGVEDGNWRVHAYELMSDHTATMNWYTVNAKTGKITTDF